MKKLTCLSFAFLLLNICFARKKLALEITIEQDTVHHLQSIGYQIKWYNRTNDTIQVRDDLQRFGRPQLEARQVGSKDWKKLWRSEEELFQVCFLKLNRHGFGIFRDLYWTLLPNASIELAVSYFPIWERDGQQVLIPGHMYEFRFVLTDEQRKMGVKQTTDQVFIDYSTQENEMVMADLTATSLHPYDLFKSWITCEVDSVQVQALHEFSLQYPGSEIANLIELKLTDWDWMKMDREDFTEKYSKDDLLQQLEALKLMLKRDFYDQIMIRELIVENLERGFEIGYTFEEYFNNLPFAEGNY